MSIIGVIPPSSTPAGWFGCFGPPLNVDIGTPTAWPVSGQSPCGNGVVESCCLFGDQCLSNGVCQILPVAGGGHNVSYYGAYCTDPTFTSPECTSNCAVEYMAYCGSNNIWQCRNTDRDHPLSCKLADSTKTGSSTFFMIEPSKLAKGSILVSTGPSTTQAQFIPTQWGVPKAPPSSSSTSFTSLLGSSPISPLATTTSTNNPSSTSLSSSVASTPANDNVGLSQSDKIAIGVGLGIGIPSILIACLCAYYGYRTLKKP